MKIMRCAEILTTHNVGASLVQDRKFLGLFL